MVGGLHWQQRLRTGLELRGGRVPTGQWRESLRSVWCGWPRAEDCAAAARRQLQSVQTRTQSRTYATATSAISGTDGDICQQQASLIAETATAASFRPFGRLVGVTEDGEMCVLATIPLRITALEYAAFIDGCSCCLVSNCRYGDQDAQLAGFGGDTNVDGGLPRLYLMRLHGPRPLEVSTITKHNRVTQCLGALSATEDFFLVVHEPTGEELPTLAGAPRTFFFILCRNLSSHLPIPLHRGNRSCVSI
eukprot:COSAG02_NODE_1382_length_12967_cov_9.151694_3_plen_249_part_00